jgi:hypothetical protein
MRNFEAKRTRRSVQPQVGLRAGASAALLAVGLTVLLVLPGNPSRAVGALLTTGALAAWVSMLLIDLLGRRLAGKAPSRLTQRAGDQDDPRIRPGDYFRRGRRLYRVEHLAGPRVLVEDCRSGELFDIDREACAGLERVKPGPA